jgi:hypothetical protein
MDIHLADLLANELKMFKGYIQILHLPISRLKTTPFIDSRLAQTDQKNLVR